MSEISLYTPLKTIVSYFLDETGKSMGDFDRYWILAFRAMIKIGMDISWEPLTIKIPVSGNGTAPLPADYMAWIKVGIMNGSGEIDTLKVNRTLSTLRDTNPNRQSYLNAQVPDYDFTNLVLNPYYLNYFFGNWYTPMFGLGNGLMQYGECRIDEQAGVIIFNSQFPFAEIVLEYISSPVKNNDYTVQTVLQEPIITFLKWKSKLATEEEFWGDLRVARRSLKPLQYQVLNQAIREMNGFKVKS